MDLNYEENLNEYIYATELRNLCTVNRFLYRYYTAYNDLQQVWDVIF